MTSDDNPYASPAAEALPLRQPAASYDDDDYRPAIKYPYVSAHGRATATVVLLALSVLLNGASLGFTVKSLGLLASAQRGESFTRAQLAEVEVIASRFASLLLIAFACRVLTIIAFLLWFYRVHRNLPALRAEHLKFTPGWAVGGWFVPVIGLFLPYQVMREVLRESDPARFCHFDWLVVGSLPARRVSIPIDIGKFHDALRGGGMARCSSPRCPR